MAPLTMMSTDANVDMPAAITPARKMAPPHGFRTVSVSIGMARSGFSSGGSSSLLSAPVM